MNVKYTIFLFVLLLFSPSFVFAYSSQRDRAIERTLDEISGRPYSEKIILQKEFLPEFSSPRQTVIKRTLDNIEIELAVKIGYLTGDTTYDFNNHTSELMFPLDNWVAGVDLTLGIKNLSFNAAFWGSITEEAGSKMTDKDWISDILISSTESKAEVDAIIFDASLRYDFYNRVFSQDIDTLRLRARDRLKIGALLGYKYERFDFDMYDIVNVLTDTSSNIGEKVLTYKIKYWIPYIGLALDVLRKDYGLKMNIKYAISPEAEDVDNHLLRELTFYGDYEDPDNSKAWLFGVSGFWDFRKNWRLSMGLDGTVLKIDGETWEESGDPAWNKDQFTDTRQLIFWSALEYKF